ncbi:MAG: dihydrofolate reductase [Candidatus Pacebacteria bacterium]|nr:dihydrofolate reductase [Candidatus Paceibacterota bacterium]
MIVSMIAAIGKNNQLGKDNTLLWHMPADMKHFRETTRGHTVIMGRKTFESLPNGPLPKRENIVVTRDTGYMKTGIVVMHSLPEALRYAALEQGKHFEEKQEETEVFIIGGGELYKEGMNFANKLYITRIDDSPEADTFFPEIDSKWKEISKEEFPADAENPHAYTFLTYKKTA